MVYCMLLTDVHESISVTMFVIGQFEFLFLIRLLCIYKHSKRNFPPNGPGCFRYYFYIENNLRDMQDIWSYSLDMIYIFY